MSRIAYSTFISQRRCQEAAGGARQVQQPPDQAPHIIHHPHPAPHHPHRSPVVEELSSTHSPGINYKSAPPLNHPEVKSCAGKSSKSSSNKKQKPQLVHAKQKKKEERRKKKRRIDGDEDDEDDGGSIWTCATQQ